MYFTLLAAVHCVHSKSLISVILALSQFPIKLILFRWNCQWWGGRIWLLPLLWFAGGMWGKGKCQKRGGKSLPVAVRWEFFRQVLGCQPSPSSFCYVPRCLRKRSLVPVAKPNKWIVERYFVVLENLSGNGKGIVANGLTARPIKNTVQKSRPCAAAQLAIAAQAIRYKKNRITKPISGWV